MRAALNPNTIMPPYYRTKDLTRVAPAYAGKPILTRRTDRGCRRLPRDVDATRAMRASRREFLDRLSRASAWSRRCRLSATPAMLEEAIHNVVGEADLQKGKVTLDVPPLVENGNAVPLTVIVDSPMSEADHVKAIHIFNEKNPQPHVISVMLGPRAGKARVATRIKLADAQQRRRASPK